MQLQKTGLRMIEGATNEYPVGTMLAAVLLMLLSPFVTTWLTVASFALFLYRVVRFDAKVFLVDYCILIPMSNLMKLQNSVPLSIYLCLLAGIWYLVRGGLKANGTTVLLFALLNYLLLRMQMNINDMVLMFGQMLAIYVLVPRQDLRSSRRAVQAFCTSLILTSVYAYILRNTSALADLTGMSDAPMWGTGLKRFSGLVTDPNYYMSLLVVGIALLMKLKDCGYVSTLWFWVQVVILTVFGVMTYSKTFFLMLILLLGIYVLWQYWNKRVMKGIFFTAAAVIALMLVFTMEDSPFAVVLNRLTSAQNFNELTTSRMNVFRLYWQAFTADLPTILFGKGLAAEALYRDPHNIYLEMGYYIGVVGFLLTIAMYASVAASGLAVAARGPKQTLLGKYVVLAMVMIIYFSLQGIFLQVLHAEMLLSVLAMMVTKEVAQETEA